MEVIATTTFSHPSHREINKLSTALSRFIVKKGIFQYIVDNTMLTNYYTLRYIASTLDSTLTGTTITQLYSQNKDELVVSFSGNPLSHLVISCRADSNVCYLDRSLARARRNTIDVLPACRDRVVAGITVLPADRILRIALADQHILIVQFFGVKANVFLVSSAGLIEDSFRSPREYRGKPYVMQETDGVYDLTLLESVTGPGHDGPLLAALKSLYPNLGATLAREVLFRTGLDVSVTAASVDGPVRRMLARNIQELLQEIEDPVPRLYLTNRGQPILFSLVSLRCAEPCEERRFDDIHDAVRFFLSQRSKRADLDTKRTEVIQKIEQRLHKARRALAAAERDRAESDRAAQYERYGALLLSHLHSVPMNAHVFNLESPDGNASIPLEAALSPAQNAQRYFSKAKRARLASGETQNRISSLRTLIIAGEYILPLLETVNTHNELKELMTTQSDRLVRFGLDNTSEARKEFPFRIFVVDGGFEVWAGKNSANNDLLTMKHTKPNDLWFHARGSSGSHVVLKVGSAKGEPTKRAKEQAAGIAAYYSRMRKATMVPVAITERKYVRKPKGAPAGTVVLEREKVIFAQPALPPGAPNQQD